MDVCGKHFQAVLKRAGGDPDVVGRDGFSHGPQIFLDFSVKSRRFLVNRTDGNPWAIQKHIENMDVLGFPVSFFKSVEEFSDADGRKADRIGLLNNLTDRCISP